MTSRTCGTVAEQPGMVENRPLHGHRIAIVGLGYVGLPTALSLADRGAEIIGCDVSEGRLADIKAGRVDLLPRDHARLSRHRLAGSIKLTTEPSALSDAHTIVICVPTPIDSHQTPDLLALTSACANVVDHASRRPDNRRDFNDIRGLYQGYAHKTVAGARFRRRPRCFRCIQPGAHRPWRRKPCS